MDYQIVWRGRVMDFTGFARVNRGMILALDSLGVDVKIEQQQGDNTLSELPKEIHDKMLELINKPYAENKKKILFYNYPHGFNIEEERKKYDYVFLNIYWETDKVPKYWFPNVNKVDAILAPSTHNKWAYQNSGINTPTFVVRHGIDCNEFNPDNPKFNFPVYEDKFKFLSVFHWQHRKAPEVLIEAFAREFRSTENVMLVIKTHIGYLNRQMQNHYLQLAVNFKNSLGIKDSADIAITNSIMDDVHIKGLYTGSDVFVLPSRGEGIGMPYLEAMASGLPVIATPWGGQTDFLNKDNSLSIGFKLEPTTTRMNQAIAEKFDQVFTNKMNWAEPSLDDLRLAMRYAFEHQDEMKTKGIQARKDAEQWTWEVSAKDIVSAIERVVK